MRKAIHLRKFLKDYQRMHRRGFDTTKLDHVMIALAKDGPLPSNARPHKLVGKYTGYWDVHVAPDWVLIYQITDTELTLIRTGTHSDLF